MSFCFDRECLWESKSERLCLFDLSRFIFGSKSFQNSLAVCVGRVLVVCMFSIAILRSRGRCRADVLFSLIFLFYVCYLYTWCFVQFIGVHFEGKIFMTLLWQAESFFVTASKGIFIPIFCSVVVFWGGFEVVCCFYVQLFWVSAFFFDWVLSILDGHFLF